MKRIDLRNKRLQRRLLATALTGCLAALSANAVYAQSANAALRGTVVGTSGSAPAAGINVQVENIDTGLKRSTTTGADGSYSLQGLPPGTYTVDAGAGQQVVTLSVASTATLNLQGAAGGVAETANGEGAKTLDTVRVTAPILREVKTSEVGDTISQHQIRNLPQSSRNFLEFADTVPGMTFEDDGAGHTTLKGGAMNKSSTNVYIDGVGQKSYVKEGGVAGQIGSAGNPFPQLAIGEYKVITSNYKAEYGQVSSAAVTAATKSGTNDFHGEAFYQYTNDDMRARRPAEQKPGADKTESTIKEFGVALGGPIIQDTMHFFITYEGKRFGLPTVVAPSSNATAFAAYLPSDVASQFGNQSKDFTENLYFGKIDWEPTDNDRFELSAQIRKEEQEDHIGGTEARSFGTFTDNYDKRYLLRWEHSADRWFNEALVTREDSFNNPLPLNYGNGYIYTVPTLNNAEVIKVGAASPLSAQTKGQKGWSFEDNLTFNGISWHGDHTIKMGVRYKKVDLSAADALDINPQFYYDVTEDGTSDTPYKAFFTKPITGIGGLAPSITSSDKQIGAYIQDDWEVNDKLTLNLGVRWDYEELPSYLDFVTPQNVVDALNGPDPNAPGQTYAQSLANGGIDINDYISTGNNRKAFKGAWQPRLGFSYDLNADEKHVIHGGAGRSYDRDLFDYLQLEVTKAALPQFTVYFQDPATGECIRQGNPATPCYAWDPNLLNGIGNLQALVQASNGGEVDLLNNDLKVPYSDQFSLGMSNQVGDWLTDITVTRVLSYDGFAFTLGNRFPNGDFFENGGQPWGNGVPGFGGLILGSNGIQTRSTQFLLSAQKPYTKESGWGATFAYTLTNAKQNRDINEHYSFDYPTIQDYPYWLSNSVPQHRFVATGTLDGPWGISFGAKLTLETPTPQVGSSCGNADDPNHVFVDGEANCIVRQGIPAGFWGYRDLDLQATKEFKLGDSATLYARLDLLNVFNWKNYSQYAITSTPKPNYVVRYNTDGDITYYPRTIRAQIGFRF